LAGVLFWILIALLTGAAVLAVLMPLGRASAVQDPARQARDVYRDQLGELQRDRAEGRISAEEAEAARAEIARRLIATENEAAPATGQGSRSARRGTALAALVGIPVLTLVVYLGLGAPNLPGQPLAARLAAPTVPDDIDVLLAKVEEHLAQNPGDGRGWEVIAPVYLRLGRMDEAATAYRNAIRLLGPTAARQTGLGEAILASEEGVVTADARRAFEAATAADPSAPGPRFYLALAAEQEGKPAEAAKTLHALLADAPADAPWRGAVVAALARVEPGAQPTGPNAEQVAAAETMAPADRTAMIETMVSGLAERLKDQPDNVEGWLKLIRSYVVLGRADDAAEAARDALQGVQAPEARSRVEALIADLHLTPQGAQTQ
jgi:cytochrome c-type biogenesis protein CcmH